MPCNCAQPLELGWTKVGTLCTQDDFASQAINEFEKSAMDIGLVITTSAEFIFPGTQAAAEEAVLQLKNAGVCSDCVPVCSSLSRV